MIYIIILLHLLQYGISRTTSRNLVYVKRASKNATSFLGKRDLFPIVTTSNSEITIHAPTFEVCTVPRPPKNHVCPSATMSHVFMSIMSSCELLSIRHLDVLRLKARVFHTHIHTHLTSTRKNEVSNLKGPVKASHVSVQIASIPLQSVTVKTSTALSHQPSAMLIGD